MLPICSLTSLWVVFEVTRNEPALFDPYGISDAEIECNYLLSKDLAMPAYDQCLKASHIFNLLDSRGVIGVAQRTEYISRIRELAKGSGQSWLESQK